MMHRDIKRQLKACAKKHRHAMPDQTWVEQTRTVLLQQIQNTVRVMSDEKQHRFSDIFQRIHQISTVFVPKHVLAISRSVGMAALAMSVAVGGWIASVSASVNSLPGDALYNVKLATEKTELIVATTLGNQKDKVETLLRHASNRVEEYQKSKTTDQAVQVIESLKKSIASANETLADAGESGEEVAEVAKVVNEKTDELIESLADAPDEHVNNTATDPETAKKVDEATHLLEVTSVNAVQVLVEQTLVGNTAVNVQEVKDVVGKKLDHLASGVTKLNENVAVVSAVVGSSSQTQTLAIVHAGSDVATTTAGVADANSLALSVGEASKIVEQGIAEAKTLIQNNDLLGAVKKVQTLTEVKKDADVVVREATLIGNAISSGMVGSGMATTTATVTTATGTEHVTQVSQ